MRTSEVDILIVPGWSDSGPDHWQSRWERSLPTARRVQQGDWVDPDRDRWVGALIASLAGSSRPPVIVAHSLGVIATAYAALKLPPGSVAGAFLVAPADVENAQDWPTVEGQSWVAGQRDFAPIPLERLPFPSVLVASDDDPFCSPERAAQFAAAWGSDLVMAGNVGHLNTASGHGPWPDGLLRFGRFLKSLPAS